MPLSPRSGKPTVSLHVASTRTARLEVPVLGKIRCKVVGHRWGPLEGDNWGGYHTCGRCGRTKRFAADHPPEAHDHLGINR